MYVTTFYPQNNRMYVSLHPCQHLLISDFFWVEKNMIETWHAKIDALLNQHRYNDACKSPDWEECFSDPS